MLDLAVLGLLAESPLHGYELRKRLSGVLGPFRALSYGSLYPCLRRLQAAGYIEEAEPHADAPLLTGRRGRVVYRLTGDGKDRLAELLAETGPTAFEDGSFDVHFAFFGRTPADVRLRVLEGRRARLLERRESARQAAARRRERLDTWTSELQRHGLEAVDREVRWLSDLIDNERRRPADAPDAVPAPDPTPTSSPARQPGSTSEENST